MPDGPAQSPSESQFDLFISYSREDIELVRPLVARLISDGFHPWFDESDMRLSGTVAENLNAALDSCHQTLVCLSDTYCAKEYTLYELQLNFLRDPANKRKRTIPVIIRRPLTVEVPPEIKIIPWADLTNPSRYDAEYRRIVQAITTKRPSPRFASPAEVQALRRLTDPDKALGRMMRHSVEINTFIFQQEVGGPIPTESAPLASRLVQSSRLPADMRFHIDTIQRYADLIKHQGVKQSSVEPALLALYQLTLWATTRYHVEHAAAEPQDPFEFLWRHLAQESGHDRAACLPNSTWELAEGRRQLTVAGALYRSKNTEDGSVGDLLLLPVTHEHSQEFAAEMEYCVSLGDRSPLQIRASGRFETGEAGEWRFLVLAHPDPCTFEDLRERFSPLPEGVALAVARQIVKAFQSLHKGAPALAQSLFHYQNLTLDRSGAVHLAWDWDQRESEEGVAAVPEREAFWFCRANDVSGQTGGQKNFDHLRRALLAASQGIVPPELMQKLEAAESAEQAAKALAPAAPPRAEDPDVVRVAVESWIEHKDLPAWLAQMQEPESPLPPLREKGQESQPLPEPIAPAPVTRTGFRLAFRIPLDCLGAWPLDDSHLVVWQSDQRLAIFQPNSARLWCDAKPVRVRRVGVALASLAVGSWEGDLRWFGSGQLLGSASAAWTIGDLQPYRANWLAGSWNGQLLVLGSDGGVKSVNPAPEDGVCRIAVSRGERFATLSMRGAVSIYQGNRTGQSEPIPFAHSLAFANGALVVLTDQGLVTVEPSGRTSTPDRLPARGPLRLVAFPPEEKCLLVNERGQSWVIDRTGTYPRGGWLPRGDDSLSTASGFRRCIAVAEGGGYAYWRDGFKVRYWPEALSAAISADGSRLVVAQPGAIEVYEEDAA